MADLRSRDDGEPTVEVDCAMIDQVPKDGCGLLGRGRQESEIDHRRWRRMSVPIDQLAEVAVERQEKPAF
ncbi:MAG TPA: hypothetical protein VF170_14940 [Planctomycetaceae bacterium]